VWQLAGTPVQSVRFVFDDRNNVEWRQAIKKELADYAKWKWPLLPVEFKTKKKAMPIQAADMLVYRSHQFTVNMGKGKVWFSTHAPHYILPTDWNCFLPMSW